MRLSTKLTAVVTAIAFTALLGMALGSVWSISGPLERMVSERLNSTIRDVDAGLGRQADALIFTARNLPAEIDAALRADFPSGALRALAENDLRASRLVSDWLRENAEPREFIWARIVNAQGTLLAATPDFLQVHADAFADEEAVNLSRTNAILLLHPKMPEDPTRRMEAPILVATRAIVHELNLLVGVPLDDAFLSALTPGSREVRVTLLENARAVARVGLPAGSTQSGQVPLRLATWSRNPSLSISAEVQDPLRAIHVRIAVTLGVFFTFFALFAFTSAWFFSRQLTAPITSLIHGAERVAAGHLKDEVPLTTHDRDLAKLIDAFNRMTRDLQSSRDALARSERIAAWRDMARRIAHEVKNPLTPIQLAVQTLQRTRRERPELFDEVLTESSSAILEEVERLRRLVTEFSDFARMPSPLLVPTSLNGLVEHAASLHRGISPGVSISLDLDPSLPAIDLDPDQIARALTNLVKNAIEACGDEGQITLSTRRDLASSSQAILCVRDTGCGIDPAIVPRLFEPYVSTKAEGTGLGLSIVERIVHDHGGVIRYEAAADGGSMFLIQLHIRSESVNAKKER